VRFFTVSSELAFCVHGALAAGFVEAMRRGCAVVTLAAADRLLRIARTHDDMAYLALPAVGISCVESDPAPVLAALGLTACDVANDRIEVASIGSPKWLVRVRDRAALTALRPDMRMLALASAKAGVNGAYVYVQGDEAAFAEILARGFNPHGGVDEDAATGSAAAALAWSLRDALQQRWLTIDQGIGLTALNRIRVRIADGTIQVGGRIGHDPRHRMGGSR
jgi:PhzF family phenazine biosynthesis protein